MSKSNGSYGPITCCDQMCADDNGCMVGGLVCADCGRYFCADDVSEYNGDTLCDDCKSDREQEEGDDL